MTILKKTLPASKLNEVRTGGIEPIAQSGILSGINKSARIGDVHIHTAGVGDDRQAENFHGGGDRAVLQYDPAHYAAWVRDMPQSKELFHIGSFGENLVAASMSERNMCVGDKVRVGEVLLELTQFRQPCFKLNHRFNDKNMSRQTQATGRTGWFYRVLEEGMVKAGDTISVVERPLPEWTISRLQHYVYDASDDIEMARVLMNLPFLGDEIRGVFTKRVESNSVEDWGGRLSNGPVSTRPTAWRELRLTDAEMVTPSVRCFRFEDPDGGALEQYAAGAHIDVKACNAFTRSYSLTSLPDGLGYDIAVKLDPASSGGSEWMHKDAKVDDLIMVATPRNFFPLVSGASHYKLIAGGIGVTPILSMIEQLEQNGANWELRYCAAFKENAPFSDALLAKYPNQVHLHLDGEDATNQLDVAASLKDQKLGEHVYCCGPPGLMNAVRNASRHWADGSVHFELFSGPPALETENNERFSVTIGSSGQNLEVPADATLLDALRDNGFNIDSQCEAGTCGTCRIGVISGEVDHRDMVLSAFERKTSMMCCTSRGKGKLVLDL